MASYPDIDKIDTNIRHAKCIIELIMDNIGNKLLIHLCAFFGVDKQEYFSERNASDVFHSACSEVWHRNEVEFCCRLANAVIVLKPLQ